MVPFIFHSFAHSDIGLVRQNNEDVALELSQHHFYILADGMGGHKAGEVAAQETVVFLCDCVDKMFKQQSEPLELNTITNALKTFILRSNERIYQLGQENSAYQGMGTTVSSMLFYQNSLVCAHVGDSRIYRYRHNTLTLLTYDHTLKNKLLQQGRLDEAIAKGIRYKNVLTKAIGAFKTVTPDILISPVEPGDLYIMCSDGLSDYLSDEEMLSTLTLPLSLQELTFQLIQQAKAKGGCDNITVLVTKVSST